MTFSIGENVGAYRIVEQLGQGGMATVFKAYHAALDRYVAIKVLHAAFKEDPTFLARFQREARVVARLEHPNIVPVYDYAEHNGSPYLVMKFIEGETLKARLARGPLPPAETRRVVEAVGAGLDYAHKQGILHRDIKPSNIMLAHDGNIYLADFGLARIALAGESTLSTDSMLGTPQYMSPEQAKGVKELDAGTDIYSFGVVAYELTVGRVPYSADTPFAVIHDHIFTPLPLPHVVNPKVSEAVERVLLKALAKERGDRYPDVAAFVAAFWEATAAAAAAAPTIAMPAPETTQASPSGGATMAVPPAAVVQAVKAEAEPAKVKIPWVWVGVSGVAIVALVLVAAGLLLPRLHERRTAAGTAQARSTAAARASVTAAAPGKPVAPPDLGARFDPAGQAFDNKNPDKGFALLDQVVASDPKNPSVLLQAGDTALLHGAEFAWPALSRYYAPAMALVTGQQNSVAASIRGHTQLAMYAMAQEPGGDKIFADLAASFRPAEWPLMAKARWELFSVKDDFSGVEKELADLMARHPDNVLLYLFQGDLYLKEKRFAEAEKDYGIITLKGPGSAPGWAFQEAQCKLKTIRQDRLKSQLERTCVPLLSLVIGK